jgi:uncharacterized membrane protein YphA (DoxX/SURF4 family)
MADEGNSSAEELFFMILLIFLALFFVVEGYMEKQKFCIGHTTGIIVMLGILISWSFHHFEDRENGAEFMKDL